MFGKKLDKMAETLGKMKDMKNQMAYYIALAVLLVVLEGNALKGKLGPMTTVKGVISCGFALAAVVYGMMEVIL